MHVYYTIYNTSSSIKHKLDQVQDWDSVRTHALEYSSMRLYSSHVIYIYHIIYKQNSVANPIFTAGECRFLFKVVREGNH